MCFSASASFGASTVLLVIGAAAIKKSETMPQRLLACIPLIFSIQQFSEGVLWLSFMHTEYFYWRTMATYGFLIFAQIVWPFFVPLSVLQLEENPTRKKILAVTLCIGGLMAIYFSWCLLSYPVSASIEGHHVRYSLPFPLNKHYTDAAYLTCTLVALLVSGNRNIRLLGLLFLVSLIVTKIFYNVYVTSVWCYFAAIISVMIVFIIVQLNKPVKTVMVQG